MHELKEKIRIIFNEIHDWLEGLFQLGMSLAKAKKIFSSQSENNYSLAR